MASAKDESKELSTVHKALHEIIELWQNAPVHANSGMVGLSLEQELERACLKYTEEEEDLDKEPEFPFEVNAQVAEDIDPLNLMFALLNTMEIPYSDGYYHAFKPAYDLLLEEIMDRGLLTKYGDVLELHATPSETNSKQLVKIFKVMLCVAKKDDSSFYEFDYDALLE